MKQYSYTIIAENLNIAEVFYTKIFKWTPALKNEHSILMDTKSPLMFSLVDKKYLDSIGIKDETNSGSFCTWLYDNETELLLDMKQLLHKGVKRIGLQGYFFKDEVGFLWELRRKDELL